MFVALVTSLVIRKIFGNNQAIILLVFFIELKLWVVIRIAPSETMLKSTNLIELYAEPMNKYSSIILLFSSSTLLISSVCNSFFRCFETVQDVPLGSLIAPSKLT